MDATAAGRHRTHGCPTGPPVPGIAHLLVLASSIAALACGMPGEDASRTTEDGDDAEPSVGAEADDGGSSPSGGDGLPPGDDTAGSEDPTDDDGNDDGADDGPGPPVQTCTGEINSTLPEDAPVLTPGVWVDLTPPDIPQGDPEYLIAQGVTIDPCDHGTVYWTSTPFGSGPEGFGGLYKSVNAGATWTRMGDPAADDDPWDETATFLDMPLHVRIDPTDSLHMYAGDGVRGGSLGFWVSHDGGESWAKSQGWLQAAETAGFIDDVYDVAVNPTDFDHVLVSSHSAWDWDNPGHSAGVLESRDGGETWTIHPPEPTWGYGHSISFLYEPDLGIGDADTWLLGTQGDGYWRTTDAGATWAQVTTSEIFHGGGEIYYGHTGLLFATSADGLLRSTDNGASFQNAGSGNGNTGIIGDGKLLYTAPAYAFGPQPFVTSPEDDGLTWTAGSQTIEDSGPFEMALDPVNRIIYAAMWFQGVWALKLPD